MGRKYDPKGAQILEGIARADLPNGLVVRDDSTPIGDRVFTLFNGSARFLTADQRLKEEASDLLPSSLDEVGPDICLYVILALACFQSYARITEGVRFHFGQHITRHDIERMDPTAIAGNARLSDEMKELYADARANFIAAASEAAITDPMYRVFQLQELYDAARGTQDIELARKILESAAKETGGVFTNKLKVEHEITSLSDAELVARTKAAFGGDGTSGANP